MAKKKKSIGRSVWTGGITLGMINVGVKAYTAQKSDSDVKTCSLTSCCSSPVFIEKACKVCGKLPDDTMTGVETASDEYVVIDKSKLPESDNSDDIEIKTFLPFEEIDFSYAAGKSHYLVPSKTRDKEAYAILYTALSEMGVVGICEAVISKSPGVRLIRPFEGLLTLVTVYYHSDIKPLTAFAEACGMTEPLRKHVSTVKKIIRGSTKKGFDLSKIKNKKRVALERMINKEIKAGRFVSPVGESDTTDLVDQLAESLEIIERKQAQ